MHHNSNYIGFRHYFSECGLTDIVNTKIVSTVDGAQPYLRLTAAHHGPAWSVMVRQSGVVCNGQYRNVLGFGRCWTEPCYPTWQRYNGVVTLLWGAQYLYLPLECRV